MLCGPRCAFGRIIFVFGAFVASCGYAIAGADEDASGLLARYKAFLGPQIATRGVASLSEDEGIRSDDGVVLATVHGVRRGLAVRATTQLPDGTTRSRGYTGRVFWESNENGFTHPVIGDALRRAVAEELLFNGGAAALSGAKHVIQSVDAMSCEVVEVKVDASAPLDLCLDPRTGRAMRAVIDAGRSDEETIEILGYADTPAGSRLISKWRIQGENRVHDLTKVVANPTVSDADLHPPAPATWTFANGVAIPIEVLDSDRERGFFVESAINGVPGRFLIDTGSSGIILSRTFAGRARLHVLRNARMSGFAGDAETQLAVADSLKIGGNVLSKVFVTVLDSDLSGNDSEIDGLLGYDMFGGVIAKLDPQEKSLTLFDPSTMHLEESAGIALTVGLEALQPVIPMTLNGHIPVTAMLDTGDLFAAIVSSRLARKYNLRMLVDRSASAGERHELFAQGIGGKGNVKCGSIDSLTIAAVVYQGAMACQSNQIEENTMIVGFDFLKNFTMYFDYPLGKIVLQPH